MIKKEKTERVVVALLRNAEGKYLITVGTKWRGAYVLPGGHIEHGETERGACIREMYEELHISLKRLHLLAHIRKRGDGYIREAVFDAAIFTGEIGNGEIRLNDEASAYKWVSKDGLRDLAPPFSEIAEYV
ncbi:MAG: NUDIX hydrolase [Nitrososphaerota archaeon]|nr:NUDIX hydrolase [Nitrososphaerota archaeon]